MISPGNWSAGLHYLPVVAIAFATTSLAVPPAKYFAARAGCVSLPATDRWHLKPTPLLGGAAVMAGFVVALLPWAGDSRTILVGAIAMFIVGLIDDVWTLMPLPKFALQFAVVAMILMHCPWLELSSWSWLDPVLTVVWLLTAVNAFNF